MSVPPSLLALPSAAVVRPTVLAIGNFDGVHRGHQALLAEAVRMARDLGATPYALTFDPHPVAVLTGKAVTLLTTLERRAELVVAAGVRGLLVQRFDHAFSKLSPEAFFEELLVGDLAAAGVVVGADFRFGQGRAGDGATLERLGAAHGVRVHAVRMVEDDSGPVGSRRIRQAIAEGDVQTARELLGRPHAFAGLVERGQQRGRTIGFPTANVALGAVQVPAKGVYAAHVSCGPLGPGRHLAVVNIGERPTLNDGRGLTVEAHVLGANADLYGHVMEVAFVARLRDEQRFSSLSELQAAIAADCAAARTLGGEGAS
jgi:riboflavin kinase / FMN adenylyltransferase